MYNTENRRNFKDRNSNFNKDKNNIESIKYKLVDYIYSTVDLSQFKYEMLEHPDDLPKLFNNKYYLTANFIGINCLLIFTKIKEKFYAFTIDRKTLSYSKSRVDIDKVDLKYVSVELDSSIYSGSIFDGVLVKNGNKDQFIISDVYIFKGTNYQNIDLDIKLFELRTYLEHLKGNLIKNTFKSN